MPPNEIHLAFTSTAEGTGYMTAQNDQTAGPNARSVVVHPRERLLGPEGERWDDTQTRMVSDRALVVGVVPDLARQGEYTVSWCTLTPDGHSQSGAYVFSYAGPTSLSTRPPATADASADCRAAAARDGAALLGWPIVWLLAAFVLFLVTASLLNRRTGQRPR